MALPFYVFSRLLESQRFLTFEDYANDVFLPYIRHQLEGADRVDVVWDISQQQY